MTYPVYWPGTGIEKSQRNAFTDWQDGEPSIFLDEKSMRTNKSGLSNSLTATQTSAKFERENGRSRGTVFGISSASDKQSEEFQRRMAAKRAGLGA